MDKTIGISELRKSMASVIEDVYEKGIRYIILQNSRARAVLLSPEDLEALEALEPKDIKNGDSPQLMLSSYESFFGKI